MHKLKTLETKLVIQHYKMNVSDGMFDNFMWIFKSMVRAIEC